MNILRSQAASAFSNTIPIEPKATFIDGQIKLMKPDCITQWHSFLYSQFTSVIMRHFQQYHASTVILAFDDKANVPFAKSITQLKRRSGVQVIEFGDDDVLPNEMPSPWIEAVMNASFKARLIEYICNNVPRLITPPNDCVLIIDWKDTVAKKYTYTETGVEETTIPKDAVGEADLKFPMWMKALRVPMLIEATDGDYIPIALSMKTCDVDEPITILKGKRGDDYEFISVDTLQVHLQTIFNPAIAKTKTHSKHVEIKLFITLLGLAGTDFSRPLPLISPNRVFQNITRIAVAVLEAFRDNIDYDHLTPAVGINVFKVIYTCVFPKHFTQRSPLSIVQQAARSSWGPRNKALVPSDARIVATFQNINFLLVYWLHHVPPPVEELAEYGFDVNADTGKLEWGGFD